HGPTGEILAMGSAPTFDPNDLSRVDPDAIRNRAVTDTFEPGSTQKLITVAAALEEGVFRPGDVLEVPETITIHDKEYKDVGEHPAQLTVADIVTYSSNVGTILIQQELGNEKLHEYLDRFGFGQTSGLDFPGEAGGVLREPQDWCETTCGANTAIGYRVSVTALQMAAAYATVANDGVWIQPHLIKEIVDADGARRPFEPAKRPVISTKTAAQLRVMLEGVVDRGTGTNAEVDGYRIGGKTGTTKKYDPELFYEHERVVASFIGMGPIDDPEVVVAVVIDTPGGGEFGGEVAAPVFAEIMAVALHQLGVPADE
ncbi:MAG: penicillin-binding protein 2, partial [Acidimicrobiia bacterium]|nr:penicillin-binding protein 2 [Acidimicrobiia bacterium]